MNTAQLLKDWTDTVVHHPILFSLSPESPYSCPFCPSLEVLLLHGSFHFFFSKTAKIAPITQTTIKEATKKSEKAARMLRTTMGISNPPSPKLFTTPLENPTQ